MPRVTVVAVLLAGVCAAAAPQLARAAHTPTQLLLHDASGALLRPAAPDDADGPQIVSAEAAPAVAAVASGRLLPPYSLGARAASELARLMHPQKQLGSGPRGVVLLNVAGVAPGSACVAQLRDALAAPASAGGARAAAAATTRLLDVVGSSAAALLQASGDLVAANPGAAKVAVLDHTVVQDCPAGSCLARHLATAMHHCGGKHHATADAAGAAGATSSAAAAPAAGAAAAAAAAAGLTGTLQLPGASAPLDLSLPASRLFALELAGLQGSAQQLLASLRAQDTEEGEALAVVEGTFVGLQALAAQLPARSELLPAAEAALGRALAHTAAQLREAFGGQVLVQVALLGDAPVPGASAAGLLDWKQGARRTLLQAAGAAGHRATPGQQQQSHATAASSSRARSGAPAAAVAAAAADSKRYAEKATAYGVTLLLLWFACAGVYCMTAMRFKEDTLLYGRAKAD